MVFSVKSQGDWPLIRVSLRVIDPYHKSQGDWPLTPKLVRATVLSVKSQGDWSLICMILKAIDPYTRPRVIDP